MHSTQLTSKEEEIQLHRTLTWIFYLIITEEFTSNSNASDVFEKCPVQISAKT